MDYIIEENDLMKSCSDCGILKMKTDFYFRNINQKLRKECVQCTKMKQKVYDCENREKSYKNKIFNKTKGELTNIKNNMLRIELKQMLIFV